MLHGDSKSQNSDYGSFCNTPCDNFVPGPSTSAVGHAGPFQAPSAVGHTGPFQAPSSAGDHHHRGHQRNDSEIQCGNVSPQFGSTTSFDNKLEWLTPARLSSLVKRWWVRPRVEHLKGASLRQSLVLRANIRLVCKGLSVTITLTPNLVYYGRKMFYNITP